MKYKIETQLPNSETWHNVIDMEKSKSVAITKLFDSESNAIAYAKKYVPKNHEWRVVEDEVQ